MKLRVGICVGENVNRPNKLIRYLWSSVFLIAAFCVFTVCQGVSQEAPAAEVAQPDVSGAELPASRIISILQQDPGLLEEVKREAVQKLAERGIVISESELTNDRIFRRLEQDSNARVVATQQLIQNGYVDKNDPDLTIGGLPVSGTAPVAAPAASAKPGVQNVPPANRSVATPQINIPTKPAPVQSDTGETVRRQPPYQSMPALLDLYVQSVDPNTPLERFGMSLFRHTTRPAPGAEQTDIPAGSDYVVGPGDGLTVEMWGSISRRVSIVVDREGRISLPEVGTVFVAGKSLAELREIIPRILRTQFNKVEADVSLSRLRSVRIYVVGEVRNPGGYDIPSLSTVVNAITAAGGLGDKGSMRMIRHFRGPKLIREFDIYDLLLHGIRTDVDRLEPGDTVLVPTVGPQVWVSGMVRRPAIYELKNEQSLAEVLQLAGGVLVSGSLQQISIQRVEPHQRRVMLSLDVPQQASSEGDQSLRQFVMKDGDKVAIAPIPAYSNETVYLDGHVLRPGKYPFRKGLTVADLIRSYRDMLPEPSSQAEIIRLTPPEHKPRVMQFDLTKAMDGSEPVELQPFDTVRVYGRYDYDPPKVAIYGEVLRPGEYPMSEGMNATDLVRLAGGFKRSAFTKTADLTSYTVTGGEKVETDHRTVEINSALSGVADTDVRLKPGDVLSVRQLSGWEDIGGSVKLSGEVVHPGTYGIEQGERLSSILRRAGGLRSTAYPNGAVLERVQVRELDQKSRDALIRRVESSTPKQATETAAFFQQQQQILKRLKETPVSGRQVIRISADLAKWENTAADIEVRPGDTVFVPKKPNFVLVEGQVNSPSAITFAPGKNAEWYLRRSGGATSSGDKKKAFIVRADGSVVGSGGSGGWWSGGPLSTVLQPGDSVVVPEKIVSENTFWKNTLNTAQIVSSIAIAARVATSF